jgi:hypothetical protein
MDRDIFEIILGKFQSGFKTCLIDIDSGYFSPFCQNLQCHFAADAVSRTSYNKDFVYNLHTYPPYLP